MKLSRLFVASVLSFVVPLAAGATEPQPEFQFEQKVRSLLEQYSEDPEGFMDWVIEKGTNSASTVRPSLPFQEAHVQDGEFIEAKDLYRGRIANGLFQEEGRAPIESNDRPENLIDSPYNMISTLDQIQARNLLQATLPETPWSDDYWAIYKGVLGYRYADWEMPSGQDWLEYFTASFRQGFDLLSIWESKNTEIMNQLSPSEKYDLLIGNLSDLPLYDEYWKQGVRWSRNSFPRGYLTPGQWAQGQSYYSLNEKVETWMGICHGWAAAAYAVPRPEKAVTVMAADGRTPIKFYPADIKALASYLWAEVGAPSAFIGGRCNTKDPEKDPDSNRVIDSECFDTNPGAWHLSVVNQIGVNQRSFVLDATYDYEVWNQPVSAYQYTYFDPVTQRQSRNWREVVRDIADAKFVAQDNFKDFRFKSESYYARNPHMRPAQVVGVAMEVTYVVETQPEQREFDSPEYDATHTVTYLYDLELNARGEIIGGEWYTNTHPDFLWNIQAETVAAKAYYGPYDGYVRSNWEPGKALPSDWSQAAKRASLQKQPLGKIVDRLIELANQ